VEIKSVLEVLLGQPLAADPEENWPVFVDAVAATLKRAQLPLVYCPVRNEPRPWIDIEELAKYVPDPVGMVVELNEDLLWKVRASHPGSRDARVVCCFDLPLPPFSGPHNRCTFSTHSTPRHCASRTRPRPCGRW